MDPKIVLTPIMRQNVQSLFTIALRTQEIRPREWILCLYEISRECVYRARPRGDYSLELEDWARSYYLRVGQCLRSWWQRLQTIWIERL
jgi:hypothetical protein